MENLKIKVSGEIESREAQGLFEQLGYSFNMMAYAEYPNSLQVFDDGSGSLFEDHETCSHKEITIHNLRDMVVLHRNDPEDANYSISVTSDRPDQPVYKTSDDLYYTYSENNGKWVLCRSIASTTTGLKPITKETLNDIARTADDYRQKLISGGADAHLFIGRNALHTAKENAEKLGEHNLSNELNDLCAEFGCLPGVDRMAWLRDRLRATKKPRGTETLYHYSASINTARGTVSYDGVITMPERIRGIEDYQQARAEIAKDGNVAPDQVNVHSLSIVG